MMSGGGGGAALKKEKKELWQHNKNTKMVTNSNALSFGSLGARISDILFCFPDVLPDICVILIE